MHTYIMLNKPAGCVTACSDREEFIDFCVKKVFKTFVLIVY